MIVLSIEETEILQRFQKILAISQEVTIERVARSMKISEDELFDYLVEWGDMFPFKIRGDLIVIDDISAFTSALDLQFQEWENFTHAGVGKVEFPSTPQNLGEISPTQPPNLREMSKADILRHVEQHFQGVELLYETIQGEAVDLRSPPSEARRKNAFKTLLTTVLSVQARDETTQKVLKNLWTRYNTPQQFVDIDQTELEDLIRSVGFASRKAAQIKEISKTILEKHGGEVPSDVSSLTAFPGVGRKGANVVRYIAFGIPSIAVDAYVHRVANRLGWVATKKPEQTELALKKLVPKSEWSMVNHDFVALGKEFCQKSPLCDKCPIKDACAKKIT